LNRPLLALAVLWRGSLDWVAQAPAFRFSKQNGWGVCGLADYEPVLHSFSEGGFATCLLSSFLALKRAIYLQIRSRRGNFQKSVTIYA